MEIFKSVVDSYAKGSRKYHTLVHIEHCLIELDNVRYLAECPEAVEFALWLHDVIDPRTSDSEFLSADLAQLIAHVAKLDFLIPLIGQHIRATDHKAEPDLFDSKLVVDIDLSILGQGEEVFDKYECLVRQEYEDVPADIFRKKRVEILARFLERHSIYYTPYFRDKYGKQARKNLARSIKALCS